MKKRIYVGSILVASVLVYFPFQVYSQNKTNAGAVSTTTTSVSDKSGAKDTRTMVSDTGSARTSTDPTLAKGIADFLEQERKNLSPQFPYRINLFTAGDINKNKAGIRISETAKQFDNLGLSGLLFYYKLYDHSMRVPHWHANAVEVGVVLNGKMKITIWEGEGKRKVFTVEKNGTWMIPEASLHALENVGDTELDFIVAYNSNDAADRDFATAWAALPAGMLEKSLNLSAEDIKTLKKTTNNRLSLYDPSSIPETADLNSPFSRNFSSVPALFESNLGSIRRVDGQNTPAMQAMALQQTILNPGALREPHWYTGGDALFYVRKGKAFFTLMDSKGKTFNSMLAEGDLIFIPRGTFHAYLNTENEPLEIYEVFNGSSNLAEVSLLSGTQQFSPGTIASATGLTKAVIEQVQKKDPQKYIIPF